MIAFFLKMVINLIITKLFYKGAAMINSIYVLYLEKTFVRLYAQYDIIAFDKN